MSEPRDPPSVADDLVRRERALLSELLEINAQLDRIVAAALELDGRPRLARPSGRGGRVKYGSDRQLSLHEIVTRSVTVRAWALNRGGEAFTGAQVADELGLDRRGVASFLSGMVARGELERAGRVPDPARRRSVQTYRLPEDLP